MLLEADSYKQKLGDSLDMESYSCADLRAQFFKCVCARALVRRVCGHICVHSCAAGECTHSDISYHISDLQ